MCHRQTEGGLEDKVFFWKYIYKPKPAELSGHSA